MNRADFDKLGDLAIEAFRTTTDVACEALRSIAGSTDNAGTAAAADKAAKVEFWKKLYAMKDQAP
jgi:hypothetical protein